MADVGDVAAALRADGYFVTPPAIEPALVTRCRAAVERAQRAGVATVGAYVDDAAWELAVAVAPIAAAALGVPVVRQPSVWAWWVGGDGVPRGWPPHRDNPTDPIDDDDNPDAVTIWVPVTDATADNGCMYVVPRPWDLQYLNPAATLEFLSLQMVRAVPAPAGSVLGWTHHLIHWGALARPGAPPRVSLSYQFQRADRPPSDGPVDRPDHVPIGAARTALVIDQWHRYRHMHQQDDAALAALTAFATAG